jgi:hypothetical protein
VLWAWLLEFALQHFIETGSDKQLKMIAFADALIILTRGESVVETENYMNLEMRKEMEWAH